MFTFENVTVLPDCVNEFVFVTYSIVDSGLDGVGVGVLVFVAVIDGVGVLVGVVVLVGVGVGDGKGQQSPLNVKLVILPASTVNEFISAPPPIHWSV